MRDSRPIVLSSVISCFHTLHARIISQIRNLHHTIRHSQFRKVFKFMLLICMSICCVPEIAFNVHEEYMPISNHDIMSEMSKMSNKTQPFKHAKILCLSDNNRTCVCIIIYWGERVDIPIR